MGPIAADDDLERSEAERRLQTFEGFRDAHLLRSPAVRCIVFERQDSLTAGGPDPNEAIEFRTSSGLILGTAVIQ